MSREFSPVVALGLACSSAGFTAKAVGMTRRDAVRICSRIIAIMPTDAVRAALDEFAEAVERDRHAAADRLIAFAQSLVPASSAARRGPAWTERRDCGHG